MKIPPAASPGVPAPAPKEPASSAETAKSVTGADATAAAETAKPASGGVTSFVRETASSVAEATSRLAAALLEQFHDMGLGLTPVKSPLEGAPGTAKADPAVETRPAGDPAKAAEAARTAAGGDATAPAGEAASPAPGGEATARAGGGSEEQEIAPSRAEPPPAEPKPAVEKGAAERAVEARLDDATRAKEAPGTEPRTVSTRDGAAVAADFRQSVPPELRARVVDGILPPDKGPSVSPETAKLEAARLDPWRDVAMALADYAKTAGGEAAGRTVSRLIETFSTAQKVLLVDTVKHLKRADFDAAKTAWQQLGPSVFSINVNGIVQHVLRYAYVDGSGALQGIVQQVVGGGGGGPKPADAALKKWEERLSTLGDDAQLANIDLQDALQQQQQTLQTMASVSKMLHDAAMGVVRKMR